MNGRSTDHYSASYCAQVHALDDVNLNNNASTEQQSNVPDAQNGTKSSLKDGMQQMKPIFLKPYLSRILLFITIQFCGMLW